MKGVPAIIAADGVGGLYKGLFPTMGKSVSNQVLRFAIFNEYKRIVIGNRPEHELTVLEVGQDSKGFIGLNPTAPTTLPPIPPPHHLTTSPPHHLTTSPPHHLATSPPDHPTAPGSRWWHDSRMLWRIR